MKVQQKITLSIMGGMFTGFILFLGINHSMMRETATIEIYDKLKDKSAILTKSIDEWLGDKQRTAIALSKCVQTLKDQSPETVRSYLYLVNDAAKIDASMVYYKGKTLIHTDRNWNLSPKDEEANMPYQTMLANNFEPAISQVFKSPINKIDNMIAAIAPFNGKSLATLVVEIKDVEEKVSQTKFEGVFAVLIDANKKILVDPTIAFRGKKLSENIPELKWLEDEIFSKKAGLVEYEFLGKEYLLLFDTVASTHWKVVLTLEKEVAFANLNAQTKKLLYLSFGFFILGTCLMLSINAVHEFWRHQVEKKKDEYEFILAHRSRMSEIGELISGINHQLQQPLNALNLLTTSMLSNLKNKTLTNEILEENLHMSQQSIALMSKTIGLFRNFYRCDENISQFSLQKCIESVLQVLYIDLSRQNIGVEIHDDTHKDLQVTSVDNFIQQVLLVLLQNAKEALLAKAEMNHHKIQIFISIEKDLVFLDISDWGEGITKETKAKLFDNIKSSKKDLGSGIGLYFARKIAREKLEGDLILIQSSSPTIFRFSFKHHLLKKDYDNASTNA